MRFWAQWWVVPDGKLPSEPIADGIMNWWVMGTRHDAGRRGVTWKLIGGVVEAVDKVAAAKLVEAHWTPVQWNVLEAKPKRWLPHTSRFPSVGHEMTQRFR